MKNILPITNEKLAQSISDLSDQMNEGFGLVAKGFGKVMDEIAKVNKKLGDLESRTGKIEDRLGNVEDRLGNVEDRLGDVEVRLGDVEDKSQGLAADFYAFRHEMREDIADIKTSLRRLEEKTRKDDDAIAFEVMDLRKRVQKLEQAHKRQSTPSIKRA